MRPPCSPLCLAVWQLCCAMLCSCRARQPARAVGAADGKEGGMLRIKQPAPHCPSFHRPSLSACSSAAAHTFSPSRFSLFFDLSHPFSVFLLFSSSSLLPFSFFRPLPPFRPSCSLPLSPSGGHIHPRTSTKSLHIDMSPARCTYTSTHDSSKNKCTTAIAIASWKACAGRAEQDHSRPRKFFENCVMIYASSNKYAQCPTVTMVATRCGGRAWRSAISIASTSLAATRGW